MTRAERRRLKRNLEKHGTKVVFADPFEGISIPEGLPNRVATQKEREKLEIKKATMKAIQYEMASRKIASKADDHVREEIERIDTETLLQFFACAIMLGLYDIDGKRLGKTGLLKRASHIISYIVDFVNGKFKYDSLQDTVKAVADYVGIPAEEMILQLDSVDDEDE